MVRPGVITALVLLGLGVAQINPTVPPEALRPARGPVAVVLPLPPTFAVPPSVAAQATEVLVLVPAPVAGEARLPKALGDLRSRVRVQVRVQRRPPFLAPMLLGPNYAYLPELGGWTDLAVHVGIHWRIFNEAWQASSR